MYGLLSDLILHFFKLTFFLHLRYPCLVVAQGWSRYNNTLRYHQTFADRDIMTLTLCSVSFNVSIKIFRPDFSIALHY